jgi:hypothetical protein
MLAGSIADSKLLQITTAGKVATSALAHCLHGTTAIAALSTVSTIAGMVSITSTSWWCFNWKCFFYDYSFGRQFLDR